MKISEGSKIPLIPKSLSFLPGWKCRNNLLAIILALIFKPLARMKMAHIYMPRPHICTCMKMGPGQDQTLVATCAPPLPWSSKRYSIINNNFVTGEIFFFYGKCFILWMWRCKQPAPSRWSAHRVQMPLLITWRWFGWQLCYGMFFQNLSTGTLSNIQYRKRKTLLNITSF